MDQDLTTVATELTAQDHIQMLEDSGKVYVCAVIDTDDGLVMGYGGKALEGLGLASVITTWITDAMKASIMGSETQIPPLD